MSDTETTTPDVLCIDAGQTAIRAEVRVDGDAMGTFEFPGIMGNQGSIPQLAAAVTTAIGVAEHPVETVAIGASGLSADDDPAELLELVVPLGVTAVHLAHDVVTSYVGALGEEPGVVVAAGTGAVTMALGESELVRVDGWGHLLGDAGSGFWIGRAALEMVMRAHDGRGPATMLTGLVKQDFDNIETLYLELQADERRVARIADYAKIVAGLAESDEVCGSITQGAAFELAQSAITGLRRVGQSTVEQPLIACVGNVFKSEPLFRAFGLAITSQIPSARVIKSKSTGLDGASRLPSVSPDSPLAASIKSATR